VWGDDTSLAEGGMYPRKIPQSSNTHRRIAMPVTATATASPPSHSRLRHRHSRSTAWSPPCRVLRR